MSSNALSRTCQKSNLKANPCSMLSQMMNIFAHAELHIFYWCEGAWEVRRVHIWSSSPEVHATQDLERRGKKDFCQNVALECSFDPKLLWIIVTLYFVSYYNIYFIIRCPIEAFESLMVSLSQGASNGGLGYSRRGQARPVGSSARFGVSMHLDPSWHKLNLVYIYMHTTSYSWWPCQTTSWQAKRVYKPCCDGSVEGDWLIPIILSMKMHVDCHDFLLDIDFDHAKILIISWMT